MAMKIAFFEVRDGEKEYLQKHLVDFDVSFFPEKLTQDTVAKAKDCDMVAVFVDSRVTKDIIEKLPNLKLIATRSTGFDHIDLITCKQRNIAVCNVPHYGDNAVAEYAFALMLDLSRKIYQSVRKVKEEGFNFVGPTGFDLKEKTLGIIGTGNIGQHVARIAKGFEMNVLAYDVQPDKKLAKKIGFEYTSFVDLLQHSDIITLHVPYNSSHASLN
jgi:D-lactate dehydrogenase